MAKDGSHLTEERRKAVIARQMAESERMLNSKHPAHKHLRPVYGSGANIIEFVAGSILGFVAPLILLFILETSAPGILMPVTVIYSMLMVVIACACYLDLERAHAPRAEVAALFASALVGFLAVWLSYGGIIGAVVAYFILSHNGWLEG
jgi:hypothetical protein